MRTNIEAADGSGYPVPSASPPVTPGPPVSRVDPHPIEDFEGAMAALEDELSHPMAWRIAIGCDSQLPNQEASYVTRTAGPYVTMYVTLSLVMCLQP